MVGFQRIHRTAIVGPDTANVKAVVSQPFPVTAYRKSRSANKLYVYFYDDLRSPLTVPTPNRWVSWKFQDGLFVRDGM